MRRMLPLTLAALLAAAPVAAQSVQTFSDTDFANPDWTLTIAGINGGGTVSAFQVASGGVTGSFRRVENTMNSAIGTGLSNTVYGFHFFTAATFNPSVSGAILSLDLSLATERISSGQQAYGLVVRQGGVAYLGPVFLNPAAFNTWATTSQPGLTATSFDAVAPGVQNPNFTVTGGPIEFGFLSGNSTSVGGGGGTTVGGADNWTVTVHYDAATAATASTWGRVKALYR